MFIIPASNARPWGLLRLTSGYPVSWPIFEAVTSEYESTAWQLCQPAQFRISGNLLADYAESRPRKHRITIPRRQMSPLTVWNISDFTSSLEKSLCVEQGPHNMAVLILFARRKRDIASSWWRRNYIRHMLRIPNPRRCPRRNAMSPVWQQCPNPSSRTMALGSTQPLKEMTTTKLPGSKGRSASKADNFTAICEPAVEKMWEPRRLTTLWASMACYRDNFT
jgi:hypothetical protein